MYMCMYSRHRLPAYTWTMCLILSYLILSYLIYLGFWGHTDDARE